MLVEHRHYILQGYILCISIFFHPGIHRFLWQGGAEGSWKNFLKFKTQEDAILRHFTPFLMQCSPFSLSPFNIFPRTLLFFSQSSQPATPPSHSILQNINPWYRKPKQGNNRFNRDRRMWLQIFGKCQCDYNSINMDDGLWNFRSLINRLNNFIPTDDYIMDFQF